MDLHLPVYPVADDGQSEPNANSETAAVHLRGVGEWREYRDVDDKFDEWLERIDLHCPVFEQFSEPDSHHQFYSDGGCGPQKDWNRPGWTRFRNSSFDHPVDGNRARGHNARTNGIIRCFVAQHKSFDCRLQIGAAKYGIH